MRVVALGDVGVVQGMMHIGDEAMLHAARDELAARGGEIIAVSSAPDETATRYGVPAVGRLRFDGLDRQQSERRRSAIWALAEGHGSLSAEDSAHAVVHAVREADGVLIAGGGNLASRWPLHVYERSALVGIARRLGRPVVVTGQTLGPDLVGRDRELVTEMLHSADLVGVREATSHALAAELGVRARLGVDDASFVAGRSASDGVEAGAEQGGVLVSLSLALGGAPRAETVQRIAALVDRAAEQVGGPVRFHAHFGSLSEREPRGDAVLHEEVRERMLEPSVVLPTGDVPAAASLARSSALLITGRYHPAVFAAPAGVPVLGLATDEYTTVKQRGALGHWDQRAVIPITDADTRGMALVRDLWRDRDRVGAAARARDPEHRAATTAWWDSIAEALDR